MAISKPYQESSSTLLYRFSYITIVKSLILLTMKKQTMACPGLVLAFLFSPNSVSLS
jgi:hypothetical protein